MGVTPPSTIPHKRLIDETALGPWLQVTPQ